MRHQLPSAFDGRVIYLASSASHPLRKGVWFFVTEALTINSHDELIAAIPHILRFRPIESVICLPLEGGGPTARVDLPASDEDLEPWLKTLTEVYLHTHHPPRVALVAFGEDGPRTVGALNALNTALSTDPGPEVGPVLWVKGERWTELLTATRGVVSPSAQARIDAEYALRGQVMPLGSREELAAAMRGDARPVQANLAWAWERSRGLDEANRKREARWVGAQIDHFLNNGNYLNDVDAARFLVAVCEVETRDASALAMKRTDASALTEFWQDLTRRAPAEVRDPPATLLALSSWLSGHGAMSWTALEQLSRPNRIGELVETALRQAVNPNAWDQAAPAAAGALMQRCALRSDQMTAHTKPDGPETGLDRPGPSVPR
jgi:hypothetical protein